MKSPFRNLSLRLKIAGLIVLVVLAVDVFQLIYFPHIQMKQLQEALERKTLSLGRVLAHELIGSVEFENFKSADAVFKAASLDPDVLYAALFKQDGILLASYQLGKAKSEVFARHFDKPTLETTDQVYRVIAPVVTGSGAVGSLELGVTTQRIKDAEREIRNGTLLAGLIVMLNGMLIAWLIGASIGSRLGAMARVADGLARGELAQPTLAEPSRDEIGRMARSFNTMLGSLTQLQVHVLQVASGDLSRETRLVGDLPSAFNRMIASQRELVRRITETAVQVTTAAGEFLASAQQQERGAIEQSSAVEENRRTMETLLESARQIAKTAESVLENADRTQDNSQLVAERIATLSAQTQRISAILEVIKEIANKSDLLALNAALEGTKAGEAGRGFSLVANQMQRLAENVMGAVNDIKELTNAITGATRATVLAAEENTKLATDTNRSVRQIAMIIQQQQSATEQVSTAMEDVAVIAREAASGCKQVVASTKDLVDLSDTLRALVGRFSTGVEVDRAAVGDGSGQDNLSPAAASDAPAPPRS